MTEQDKKVHISKQNDNKMKKRSGKTKKNLCIGLYVGNMRKVTEY